MEPNYSNNLKFKTIAVDVNNYYALKRLGRKIFNENYYTSCAVILTKYHNNSIEQYSMVEDKQSKDKDEDKEKKIEN